MDREDKHRELIKKLKALNGHTASDGMLVDALTRDWPNGKNNFKPVDSTMKYSFHPSAKTVHTHILMPDGDYEYYRTIRLNPMQAQALAAKANIAMRRTK